jgi:hypothetical protein
VGTANYIEEETKSMGVSCKEALAAAISSVR